MRFKLTADALEIKPAPASNVIREAIKEEKAAAHEKVESDYAATFRKANHPARFNPATARDVVAGMFRVKPGREAGFWKPKPAARPASASRAPDQRQYSRGRVMEMEEERSHQKA